MQILSRRGGNLIYQEDSDDWDDKNILFMEDTEYIFIEKNQ